MTGQRWRMFKVLRGKNAISGKHYDNDGMKMNEDYLKILKQKKTANI